MGSKVNYVFFLLFPFFLLLKEVRRHITNEARRGVQPKDQLHGGMEDINTAAKTMRIPVWDYNSSLKSAGNRGAGGPGVWAADAHVAPERMMLSHISSSTISKAAFRSTVCSRGSCEYKTQGAKASRRERGGWEGIWQHILMVAVDVDGTFILQKLPKDYPSAPSVPCGDSTVALLSASRSRRGVDVNWFDSVANEAVREYAEGYDAIIRKYENEGRKDDDPQRRIQHLVAELDQYESRVASTPRTKQLLQGIHIQEIDSFMNSPSSPMQLPHPAAPETVLQLIAKEIPVAFISLAWSRRLIFQALRRILRQSLQGAASGAPLLFPLSPKAFASATDILNKSATDGADSSNRKNNKSRALRTLTALAAEGEGLPADTPLLAVDANEVEFDEGGYTTGELRRYVVTFSDKRHALRRRIQWSHAIRVDQQKTGLKEDRAAAVADAPAAGGVSRSGAPSQKQRSGAAAMWTVFIGDSDGDIEAFLHADIPIFIGDPGKFRLAQIGGLRLCPLDRLRGWLQKEAPTGGLGKPPSHSPCAEGDEDGHGNGKEIYITETWEQIYALFFGFWPKQDKTASGV